MLHPKDLHAARPWRLLPLLMMMTATGPVTLNIIVPALPGMVTRLGTDSATVQLALSLYLLSMACAQLLLGPLSDRFGRRPVVLAGLALSVLASLGAIAASSIGGLIAARIVQAAGAATGIVMGRAIIRDLYDRDRAAGMLGLVATAMVIAPMLAPLVGGLIDTAFGWEAIFLFITILTGAVLLWAFLILPETNTTRAASTPAPLWREWGVLFSNAKFYGYVLTGAFGCAPHFVFLGGGPHITITLMGRSSAEYGLWFTLSALGYMTGNIIVTRTVQRLGLDRLIMAGIAVEFVGICLSAALINAFPDGGPATVFIPQYIIACGNGLLLPNCISGAVSIRPQAAGTASGVTGFIQMAVGAAAAQLVSMVLGGSAMPMAWMMFALIVATAASFALVRR